MAIGHLDHAHKIELVRPDQEWRMGRVKCLVRLGQARNGGAKVALLQAMQTEARLIEQKDGVLVLVRSLGKKDNEKRNQPLETCRALIEFDFDAEIIFDHDF